MIQWLSDRFLELAFWLRPELVIAHRGDWHPIADAYLYVYLGSELDPQ